MAVHNELNGRRITSDDPQDQGRVYLILDGQRRWIPNPATYDNLFRDWNGIERYADINDIDRGTDIADGALLVNAGNGAVYLITDGSGTKRHIADPATMDAYYFNWGKIVAVPAVVLNAVPVGPDINING